MADLQTRPFDGERGTTLTEVLVIMAISALVVPTLYVAIASGFRQERLQEANLLAETKIERVADLVAGDIRNTWPSEKVWSSPSQSLNLEYFDERAERYWISWYVDGRSLVRVEMHAESGNVLSKEEMLSDMKVEEVFRYWTGEGKEIKEDLASCAARVTVDLRSVSEDTDVATTFDVAYRQRNPQADPC